MTRFTVCALLAAALLVGCGAKHNSHATPTTKDSTDRPRCKNCAAPAKAPDAQVSAALPESFGDEAATPAAPTPIPAMPMEDVTYFGAGADAEPVSPAMAAQLKLPRGTGLVLNSVDPNSPAAKAKLRQYDVITKFNDQIIVNVPQLEVLVRNSKAADNITITFIREGKPQTADVTLASHKVTMWIMQGMFTTATPGPMMGGRGMMGPMMPGPMGGAMGGACPMTGQPMGPFPRMGQPAAPPRGCCPMCGQGAPAMRGPMPRTGGPMGGRPMPMPSGTRTAPRTQPALAPAPKD